MDRMFSTYGSSENAKKKKKRGGKPEGVRLLEDLVVNERIFKICPKIRGKTVNRIYLAQDWIMVPVAHNYHSQTKPVEL
jgi:hypothetical protein